jgi:hypothetical protein
LNGYTDGTFRPDNPITRAEFAAVIVRALGLEAAAGMLEGVPVGFPDVPANHWANGYIAVASSQGVVQGYPDGTFNPGANVTYAEAIAMIVRALGYDPLVKGGVWPAAYLTQAATLGVSKGMAFNASANATRGDVAGLLANSLTIDRMVEKTATDTGEKGYEVKENNNFLFLLGATKIDEGWLIDSPELFDNDDGRITIDIDDTPEDFTLAEGVDCTGLLGHKVAAWEIQGEVVFIEDRTPESAVKSVKYVDPDAGDPYLKVGDDLLNLTGVRVFVDFDYKGTADISQFEAGQEITAIYQGKTLKYLVAYKWNYGVVDEINLTFERVLFSGGGSLRLRDVDVDWRPGAAAALEDLEKGDVIHYIGPANDKAAVIVVRDKVEGTLTKLTNTKATIDGVSYGWVSSAYSREDLEKYLGDEVVILLNKDGKFVSLGPVEEEDDTPTAYAVVLATTKGSTDEFDNDIRKILLVGSDGEEATLNVRSSAKTEFEALNKSGGDIISYTLHSSGAIATITPITTVTAAVGNKDLDVNDDLATVEVADGEKSVKVTSRTVVFNIPGGELEDVSVLTFSEFLKNGEIDAYVHDEDGRATLIVMTAGDAELGTDVAYGMVVGSYRAKVGSSTKWFLSVLIEGKTFNYVTLDDKSETAETVIGFKMKGDDIDPEAVPAVTNEVYNDAIARVTSVDLENQMITVEWYADEDAVDPIAGTKALHFFVDKDTLYYDVTDDPVSADLGDIAKFSIVDIYDVGKDFVPEVIVIKGD